MHIQQILRFIFFPLERLGMRAKMRKSVAKNFSLQPLNTL